MEKNTKLTQTPETHSTATTRFTVQAEAYAELVWGSSEQEITPAFRPTDVARIVAQKLAPALLMAREIAELERDIAEIKLAKALARIAELEGR
jgi:hypothetical protein